ncbi:probable bifunctional methylthioribulose-1-phosphate dehydratase/enolase-phosphatase E1 1 isoform X2 [Actinidia eriantha]|nr:probable bifunctional methylthioribulose-1-phosphate dehydratase/enolase-phosphatase E1 1 isoform X2 [Actinidia eriantha]
MAATSLAPLAVKMGTISQAYLETKPERETKPLTSHLCRQFYTLRWVSGTASTITIKVHNDSIPKSRHLIVMSRSVCVDRCAKGKNGWRGHVSANGSMLLSKPYPHKPPKCSDCAPLFLKVECYHYLFDDAVKLYQSGLDRSTPNYGPILNSRGVSLGHQNVNISVKAGSLISNNGMEPSRRGIVLDIEGTTTPISFVTDVLFPYARDNVGRHLDATYDTADTQDDVKLLRSQVHDDLIQGITGAVPIPSDDAGKEEVIAALVANVQAMIRADRKITALKQLQGHIWRTGFQNNELEGVVFDDVPEALEKWHALGIKVYVYSSGSRLAQRLIFGNTNYGDLRKYLCGFFDTTIG